MNTLVLHNHSIAADNKKPRRYVLCLQMTETILNDFFPVSQNKSYLFQQLGEIAYCIDTQLDDLDLFQKETLLNQFPLFFDSLGKQPDEFFFREKVNHFCQQLGTSLYDSSWVTNLHHFYVYCTQLGLGDELKEFSLVVIRSAILKSKAANAEEVLKSIKEEGTACVHFLLLVMEKEKLLQPDHKKFKSLQSYLRRLEIMLNTADAIYDYKKDKKSGVLGAGVGKSFHYFLSVTFSKAFFSTILNNHIFFLKHSVVFTSRCLRSNIF